MAPSRHSATPTGAGAITRTGRTTSRLRDMLLSGEFAPGSRLTEVVLAERLGVSRTPVRDALNTLAQEGLLGYEPNRGYEVRGFTLEDVLGAYRVRQTLEAMACAAAAEKGLDVMARATILDVNERIEKLLAGGGWRADDAREWRRLNGVFHATIIAATGISMLARTIAETQRLPILIASGGARWFTHSELVLAFDEASIRRSHNDHLQIFAAILDHDAASASRIMSAHIDQARRILEDNWERMIAAREMET